MVFRACKIDVGELEVLRDGLALKSQYWRRNPMWLGTSLGYEEQL